MKAGMRLIARRPSAYASNSPRSPGIHRCRTDEADSGTDVAFYMGWLALRRRRRPAAAQLDPPDGWSGENPKGYTRDTEIHGRFETQYVDLIQVTPPDVVKYMRKEPRHFEDVRKATLEHSLEARESVEDVYRLDLRDAFHKKDDAEARELTYKRLAAGEFPARPGVYGVDRGAKPVPPIDSLHQPQNPANPKYNPATGSVPAR